MSDVREVVDDDSPRYGGEWPRAALLASLALLPLALLVNGAALVALWHWFVVPAFSAPPIHIATAVGLLCISNLFFRETPMTPRGQTFRRDLGQLLLVGLVRPSVVTLTGFVVHYLGG